MTLKEFVSPQNEANKLTDEEIRLLDFLSTQIPDGERKFKINKNDSLKENLYDLVKTINKNAFSSGWDEASKQLKK